MSKLQKLLDRCQASVHLTVNQHKAYYETARQRLEELESIDPDGKLDVSDEVRAEMIKRDVIIELQFYPDTPVGSYLIFHYDMEAALDEALGILAADDMTREAQHLNWGYEAP